MDSMDVEGGRRGRLVLPGRVGERVDSERPYREGVSEHLPVKILVLKSDFNNLNIICNTLNDFPHQLSSSPDNLVTIA